MRNFVISAVAALAAGCASVMTHVTPLDPAHTLAPAAHTVILLEAPQRAHTTIALIEARGLEGGTEGELLEAARREGARIGADAVVRLSVDSMTVPPFEIYDPVFSPFYSRYSLRAGQHVFPPYIGRYRLAGGGTVLTLRTLAIQYDDAAR